MRDGRGRGSAAQRTAKAMDLIHEMQDHVDTLLIDAHLTAKIENKIGSHEVDRREPPAVARLYRTNPPRLGPRFQCGRLDPSQSAKLRYIEHHIPIF
jgi:hypothetical protein